MKKFTLIELLVVIVIIAILLSLLMPSLTHAKAKAKVIVCSGSQKQLYLGFVQYSKDNSGKLPYGESPVGWRVSSWEWRIGPYTGVHFTEAEISSNNWVAPRNNPLLFCPQDPYKKATSNIGFARSYVTSSVEYWHSSASDYGVIGSAWSRRLANIQSAALLLTEDHRNHDYKIQGSSWASAMGDWSWPNAIKSTHPREKFNYLYIDGHVENLEADEISRDNYEILKSKL